MVDNHLKELEKDLTNREITSAIRIMQSGIALGPDDFADDFCKNNLRLTFNFMSISF